MLALSCTAGRVGRRGSESESEAVRSLPVATADNGRRGATLALSLSRLCSQCSHRALAPVTRPPTDCRHPSPSRSTLSSSSSLARSPPSSSSARTLDTHPHRTQHPLAPPAHHGFRPPATRPGRRKGRRRPGSRRPPQGHHRPLGPDKLHRQAPALLGLDPLVRLGLEAGQGQVVGGRHRPRRLVRRRRVVLVPQLGHRPALDPRPERQLLPLQAGHQARVGGRRQRAGRQVVRPAPARQVHRPHRPLLALHRPSPLALPSRFPSFLRSESPAPPRRCSPPSARRSRRPTSRPRPTTRPRPPPRPRPHPSPRPSRTRSRASSSRPARPSSASTSGPARPRRRPRKAPPTPTTSSAASRTSAATSSTASSASPRAAWASPRTTRCRATSSSRATRTRRSACVPSLSRSRSRSRRPASSLLSLTRAPFLPAVRVQERRRVDQVDRLSASARATRGSRRGGGRAGRRDLSVPYPSSLSLSRFSLSPLGLLAIATASACIHVVDLARASKTGQLLLPRADRSTLGPRPTALVLTLAQACALQRPLHPLLPSAADPATLEPVLAPRRCAVEPAELAPAGERHDDARQVVLAVQPARGDAIRGRSEVR